MKIATFDHTPVEHMKNPSVLPSGHKHENVRVAIEIVHETRYSGSLIKYIQTLQFPLEPKRTPNTLHEM